MNHRISYRIYVGGGLGGALLALLGLQMISRGDGSGITGAALCWLGMMLTIGALGQAVVYYKCPHCGRHFSFRTKRPDYCPACGQRIDW